MIRQFQALSKKEFYESAATFRLYILLAVFLLFGMLSPLIAKATPDLLAAIDTGMVIEMPEPTALDSWTQFFKNVAQMGMIILVILYSGIMSNEFSKGTLVNLLTKGLSRSVVILAKFVAASIVWLASYLICLGTCWAYTIYFWGSVEISNAFLTFAAPWLFGEILIALLMLGGTIFSNVYGSLFTCFAAVVVLNAISLIPKASRYNPASLAGGTLALIAGAGEPSQFIPAMVVGAVLAAGLVVATIEVFKRKRV
ncbi:MAG: ABC transporter permease [Clostridiales bacterium]|jgi:ABC-2 type transport system permease protein|nr:ABC transporter permease [Clostridiales bacterium]